MLLAHADLIVRYVTIQFQIVDILTKSFSAQYFGILHSNRYTDDFQ